MSDHPSLYAYEWIVISIIIGFMGMLTAITFTQGNDYTLDLDRPHYIQEQEISVTILGEIENPGTFKLKKGSKVADLLSLAKLKPEADLRKINVNSKLRKGQTVTINKMKLRTKKNINTGKKNIQKKDDAVQQSL